MHRALYIEPAQPPSEAPVLDSLTRRAALALSRCRLGQGWRGHHTCSCGAQSSDHEHILRAIIGEIETHSLLVHYLAHHRAECPELELQALNLILPREELEPSTLMLRGWRYGERFPQAEEHPWLYGQNAHLAKWASRETPQESSDMPRRKLTLEPDGWPCKLADCPPGPFVWLGEPGADALGWMSQYGDNEGRRHAYNEAGECIDWQRWKDAMVQPLAAEWGEEDE